MFFSTSTARASGSATRRPDRRLAEMLNQQTWCWGKDVWAKPTNLLIGFGMNRHPSPGVGSHRYCQDLAGGTEIHLWAFGVCVRSAAGGIFVHRFQRRPRAVSAHWDPALIHRADQVRLAPLPFTDAHARLRDRLLRWVADYESWVGRTAPPGYRSQTLLGWEHPVVRGDQTVAAWRDLAADYRRGRPGAALPANFYGGRFPWHRFKTG